MNTSLSMVGSKGQRSLLAIGVLALSFVAVALFTPLAVADGHTDPLPEGETITVNDSIAVWDRAILTTRANDDDAVETIDNADWRINDPSSNEPSLNKDPIPIFESKDPIRFEFNESSVGKGGLLGNTEAEVIRAQIKSDRDAAVPSSASDAINLLTSENVNESVSFESIEQDEMDDGVLKFTDTPETSGQYVYFVLTESSDGFEVSDNNLSLNGSATLVGVEQVVVREGSGTVTAPESVEPGDHATFEVSASGLEEPTAHGIILYNESTYTHDSIVVNVTEDIESVEDFNLETNSRLETGIGKVNGVATVQSDLERFGVTIEDGSITRSAGIDSVIDLIGENTGEDFSNNVKSGSARLDASMTVVEGDAQKNIDVGTVDNWSHGEYRWVYVATAGDSREFLLNHGTIQVKEAEDETGGGGPGEGDEDDETTGGSGGGGGGGGVGTPITTATPTETATPGPSEPGTPTETMSPTPTDTQTPDETETTTTTAGGGGSEPPSEDGGLPAPVIVIGLAMVAAILGASLMYLRNP